MAAALLLFVAAQLLPFETSGTWGYRTGQGKVVIEPRFSIAERFSSQGIAAVCDEQGWAYIDRSRNVLVRPFIFDNGPDYFWEGLARFTVDGKFGFFDKRGHVVIKPAYQFAERFSEGRAAVCQGCRKVTHGEHWTMEGGKWGFISRSGELVIPIQFDDASSFARGRAKVRIGTDWKHIDKNGTVRYFFGRDSGGTKPLDR